MVLPEMQALNLHENKFLTVQPISKLVERVPAAANFSFCSLKYFVLEQLNNHFHPWKEFIFWKKKRIYIDLLYFKVRYHVIFQN